MMEERKGGEVKNRGWEEEAGKVRKEEVDNGFFFFLHMEGKRKGDRGRRIS